MPELVVPGSSGGPQLRGALSGPFRPRPRHRASWLRPSVGAALAAIGGALLVAAGIAQIL
ncbi:MAG: hypothetical protein IT371_32055 [Deltaproteobacteria bacterium]|nr:hypothetical protein [Deltaproteobacteria bacterium]